MYAYKISPTITFTGAVVKRQVAGSSLKRSCPKKHRHPPRMCCSPSRGKDGLGDQHGQQREQRLLLSMSLGDQRMNQIRLRLLDDGG